MSGRVVLMSSDPQVGRQVEQACGQLELSLQTVAHAEQAEEAITAAMPDLVLLDVTESGRSGFADFDRLRRQWPRLCTILVAERTRSDQAIEAMKHGAIDYLLKPLQHDELVNHLAATLRISRDMTVPTVYDASRDTPGDRIIGEAPVMHEVFKLIGLIAPREVNVLITGESGTGKELVARALYHHGKRRDHPFLAVNCAAIPETLLESELFGHEKGAFTGADIRRIGKFEQCNRGTLFLDEIGDLPLSTQAKLLRVLQDGSFQRLGSAETIHCDVRIIAATNQNLEQLIAERRFRQDLYYRLKVTSIDLPPLRDREVDAVLLAHYFVRRFNHQFGTQIGRFAPEVLPALLAYSWPGNVRELENVIKSSLVVARGTVFQLAFLPEHIRAARANLATSVLSGTIRTSGTGTPPTVESASTGDGPAGVDDLEGLCRRLVQHRPFHGQIYRLATQAAECQAIRACLEQTAGQVAPAAKLLGISRTTLRKKMSELGIQIYTSINGPQTQHE
jgi:two-component system nitrogen regulation response regulator GlnG